MHPAAIFRDDRDWLDFADDRGFATLFAATAAGPMMALTPVTRAGDALHFHLSRANRLVPHLAGAAVVLSVVAVDGYVSPNWYAQTTNQVPTWNYVAAEYDGVAEPIGREALIAQLDALAARHEPRVNPRHPWHRAKMDAAAFDRLLSGIAGFAIRPAAIRETVKLSQNKGPADRAGILAGLRAAGCHALAAAMAAA